jgi:hypothetical protein
MVIEAREQVITPENDALPRLGLFLDERGLFALYCLGFVTGV